MPYDSLTLNTGNRQRLKSFRDWFNHNPFHIACVFLILCSFHAVAQYPTSFTPVDSLRGGYGPYRANNDLIFYHLDIKVDPDKKFIQGKNKIQFKMLKADNRIQLDLFANMTIEKIMYENQSLTFSREHNAVFVNFPKTLQNNTIQTIDFYYSGSPKEVGRFGGFVFRKDSLGNDWINTACQGTGASMWWPNKDQQPDEVDSMRMSVTIPSHLVDVSNGEFLGKKDLGDGFTQYNWRINYPINNYSVSLNIAKYVHFGDKLNDFSLDFYVLPYHLEQAKRQFAQAKPMLIMYEKYFGKYPFPKDGYKLIETFYSGMEHQSAVTYGNYFKNGYLGRDWTNAGVSSKFDYIIIHESAHEWFGNSITCDDVSDAWIQEGWGTYTELVYVEHMFGKADLAKYVNGLKPKIRNDRSIIGPAGVNHWPTGDQYHKGALFLNTLRNVMDDDAKWWKLIYDYCEHFKYQNIMTKDVLQFFNTRFKIDLKPIFDQYLYNAAIPILEIEQKNNDVQYRWIADVKTFNMPVKVSLSGDIKTLSPTTEWKILKNVKKESIYVLTDLFYIDVKK